MQRCGRGSSWEAWGVGGGGEGGAPRGSTVGLMREAACHAPPPAPARAVRLDWGLHASSMGSVRATMHAGVMQQARQKRCALPGR